MVKYAISAMRVRPFALAFCAFAVVPLSQTQTAVAQLSTFAPPSNHTSGTIGAAKPPGYRDPRTARFYEEQLSPNHSLAHSLTPLRVAKVEDNDQLGLDILKPVDTKSQLSSTTGKRNAPVQQIQPRVSRPGQYWWQPLVKSRQRKTNSGLSISLNSVLVGALSNSAQVQVLADDPLINETEITTADAAFDWTTYLDARWDDLSEPVGSTLTTGGPSRLEDHNVSVEMGIRRRNPLGGEVEIGQRFGHQNNNSVFFVPNDQGTSRLTMSYTQPLLRGAGRVYNTSLTVLAKLRTDVSRDEFERQLQDHLLDVTQSYWNLYFERGKLLQQTKLLESGVEILEELESRREIDALQSQVVRARAAVENRRAELIRSRLAIKMAEARLRALVNDPGLGDTLSTELVPSEDLSEYPVFVDLRNAISIAMQNRPEIRVALAQIKSGCVRMNMSKRETLPILDLVLETYLSGLEGNSAIGRAFEEQFTQGDPSYGVGLQYEYPIWNRAAVSRLQKRRLELRRLQHQFRSTMETLKLEVEVAVHELNAAYESLDAKRKAMDAAYEEVEYLKDRWQLLPVDNGSASLLLEDLLDAQDRLSDSEQSLLQSTLEYSLAQVSYKRSIGSLLSHNHVKVDRSCECNLPAQHPFQLGAPIQTTQQLLPLPNTTTTNQFQSPTSLDQQNFVTVEPPLTKESNVTRFPPTQFDLPMPSVPNEMVEMQKPAPFSPSQLEVKRLNTSPVAPPVSNRFE